MVYANDAFIERFAQALEVYGAQEREKAAKTAECFGIVSTLEELNGLDRNQAYLSGIAIAKAIRSLHLNDTN